MHRGNDTLSEFPDNVERKFAKHAKSAGPDCPLNVGVTAYDRETLASFLETCSQLRLDFSHRENLNRVKLSVSRDTLYRISLLHKDCIFYDSSQEIRVIIPEEGRKPAGRAGEKGSRKIRLKAAPQENMGATRESFWGSGETHPAETDTPEKTPLHAAAETGNLELVKSLLYAGCDVHAPDDLYSTPLHYASVGNFRDIADLLISEGSAVNCLNFHGLTPLHIAASSNAHDVISLLVSSGADLESRENPEALTPLHIACRMGNTAAAKALIEAGANVKAGTIDGSTPLYLASSHGHREVVELLTGHGVDRGAQDTGKKPVIMPQRTGNTVNREVRATQDRKQKTEQG